MVSVIFSNDIGFCLNITFPFLISTSVGFFCRSSEKLLVLWAPHDQDVYTHHLAQAGQEYYLLLGIN